MKRILIAATLCAAPLLALGAQTTRWNDRTEERWSDEAPVVTVWFETSRALQFGSVARVRFRADDDAYVVVGRVDGDGRMTILFPYNKTTRAHVKGGVENVVRSRRGGNAYSFAAYERWGIGFVFAVASYEPMDLSRFQNRDFESYDGVMNAMARRYTGNPQRIVEKFAPWVLWSQDTPYDFDIATYSVESPSYGSYASFCGGGSYYSDYGSMYDRSFCRSAYGYYSLFCSGALGYGYTSFCYDPLWGRFGYTRQPIIANGPNAPPTTPTPAEKVPNAKLIPQIGRPDVDGKLTGGLNSLELPGRPTVGGTANDDDFDRVYSIPRRALDDMRREERIERRPIGEIAVGPERTGGIDARPTPRDRSDGRPAAGDRPAAVGDRPLGTPGRQNWGRDRENPTTRGDNPRYEPPPRESPRNFDPPSRTSDGGRFDRGGRSSEPPPRSFDPPSRSEPRFDPGPRSNGLGGGGAVVGGSGSGSGEGARSAPPPSPPPAPPASSGERKPEKPEKP